ncbi:aldo/keto reductase [Pseudolysinimonas kribbensis]|uniref:Aldo/keto reductase n=1 Tax=Pseudolysinimonas kribbensis TaxID=433641 RepID=A0ABQ6K8P9_9MICO|nr:aldo/keto reductase [Pseudolysinimonas kribbensis]GMA96367.1 aldo/keto reductase [Pseudolysinimonas kribbensis]
MTSPRTLGTTGISVGDTALGTMMFGQWGNPDHAEAVRMIHRAIDAGVNLIDTADVYANGETEEIVGEALEGRRDEVVLATKFGIPNAGDPNRQGASPRWIRLAVEASLRRLRTDWIDLYQLHRYDWTTGLDETLGALTDLQREGKIRAFGHSSFPAEKIVEAQWVSERRGHARFQTEQPRYSIVNRAIENAVLPTVQRYGMGALSYGPLAAGWLSGRPLAESNRAKRTPHVFDTATPENTRRAEIVERLQAVADGAGMPLPHLATAFVRAHPAITAVIIGPRTPEQLEDSLAASDVVLGDDVLDAIDAIVAPGTDVNPGDMYHTTPPSIADPRARRR